MTRMYDNVPNEELFNMELVLPLMSVTMLIIVTVFVLREAIQVLVLDAHRDVSLQVIPTRVSCLHFPQGIGLCQSLLFC